ncbi:hypothetical protein HPCPY3281_1262 [Helicobacter pylori CPY3281]|nr:hypothetical protein HPCPY3281_1262 [Helicobacter pylori CPY3281]
MFDNKIKPKKTIKQSLTPILKRSIQNHPLIITDFIAINISHLNLKRVNFPQINRF